MKRKIKLLFASHLFYPAVGGVEIHLKHLTEGLAKRGYDIDVVTTNAYSTEAFFLGDMRRIKETEESTDNIHIERLDFQTFGRRTLRFLCRVACRIKYPFSNWIRYLSLGPRSFKFTSRIIAHDADVIFGVPFPNLSVFYAYRAAKRSKKPLVIISCIHIFDRCCFYNKIFFKMMKKADLVIPHTAVEGEHISKEGGIELSRIVPMPPLPLQEHQLEPVLKDKGSIRKRYGIKEKHIVLYLGQHGLHKKVDVVLKAMAFVWQAVEDTALIIAGGATGYTPKMKVQASELEKAYHGKVYFLDNFLAVEKDDIFQMSDVFISLSEMESFGIVFVEAMNNGLPMIASKNGVTRLIVDDGETGILVEPKSVTEVSGAIIELLSDDGMRKRFSENARRKVIKEYHPTYLLDKWEELIAHVTANR